MICHIETQHLYTTIPPEMPMFPVSGGFRLGTYNFYNTVSPAAINAHRVKDLVIAQYKEQQIHEKAELGNKS